MRSAVSELPALSRTPGTPAGRCRARGCDVRLAELPVGAVQRQPPGAVADWTDAHQQAGQVVVADLERAEEALQALVVGVHLGLAAEAGGQLGQADAAHLEQGQQELGEEIEPRPVPGQMLGQDGP